MKLFCKYLIFALIIISPAFCFAQSYPQLNLKIVVNDGSYSIYNNDKRILHANVAAKINGKWIHAQDYRTHLVKTNYSRTEEKIVITHTDLTNQPDLITILTLQPSRNSGNIIVQVKNKLKASVTIQSIRLLETDDFNFGKNIRVLSDSYSEDRPTLKIYDYNNAPNNIHRAVGSQLFYNRDTQESLFFATLTSKRFLTILRLFTGDSHFEIDSTGTTEINKEYCLRKSPHENQVELSLTVEPNKKINSERVQFSLSSDYHAQLESYAKLIRHLFHARVTAQTPMGWWSWTAYYKELNQEQAGKDAIWLSQYLKNDGYNFLHLDEGYQAARGDYTIPDLKHFPDGIQTFGERIHALNLTLGLWTAPFEVSDRSELYKNHKDWLVTNEKAKPIELNKEDGSVEEKFYVLDATHPGAQQFLHETYSTLTKIFGAKYLKLDFMEDTAIEGRHYQKNTTALQAQRIGLNIIRDAVGYDVLLDKDGSPMLNLVGMVDTGRISVDTGHTFEKTKEAAFGIAARYYMHRNFFISDPDAFTISQYRKDDVDPLNYEEAKVSMALAVVSGGMFEIGDNLQLLKSQPERLKLLKNPEILTIVKSGQVSIPLDMMTYAKEDEQPSIFFLQQSSHQAVLTVFNWTEKNRKHDFDIHNFDFDEKSKLSEIFENNEVKTNHGKFTIQQPSHSVRMIQIIGKY